MILEGLTEIKENKADIMIEYQPVVSDSVNIYSDVIAIGDEPPGRTDRFLFSIETGQADQISSRPYNAPIYFQGEVETLGHIITPEGIQPCPSKLAAITDFTMIRNFKEVAGFLGFAGYYRKFIRGF
ncbi:uncharacterized protein [Palaemon carinicauda]|uniref:uncharacterized protein n=1 Tax=Palaemon carinicauda TaxID=392227 RepID=UPI0035B6A146